jgi:hypothetical protein
VEMTSWQCQQPEQPVPKWCSNLALDHLGLSGGISYKSYRAETSFHWNNFSGLYIPLASGNGCQVRWALHHSVSLGLCLGGLFFGVLAQFPQFPFYVASFCAPTMKEIDEWSVGSFHWTG